MYARPQTDTALGERRAWKNGVLGFCSLYLMQRIYCNMCFEFIYAFFLGLPWWLNPPVNAGDVGSIPGSGRCPGKGNGQPLQYSCLENPMDRGAWRATVHGMARVGHKNKQCGIRTFLQHTDGICLGKKQEVKFFTITIFI